MQVATTIVVFETITSATYHGKYRYLISTSTQHESKWLAAVGGRLYAGENVLKYINYKTFINNAIVFINIIS
jgi:hypothetical protein